MSCSRIDEGTRPGLFERSLLSVLVGIMLIASPLAGRADPPPLYTEPFPLTLQAPPVFCFRITDVKEVTGDAEGDRFQFEFEVLNWTFEEIFELHVSAADVPAPFDVVEGAAPFISSAAIDAAGRPLGAGDDDGNFAAIGAVPAKVGQTNSWGVTSQTATAIQWEEATKIVGAGLDFRDLILAPGQLAAGTQEACDLVPGCVVVSGTPTVADPETVDNASFAFDAGVDNVLDGFVLELDDFDPGETASFNWFMLNAVGAQPTVASSAAFGFFAASGSFVGVNSGPSAFGFGVINLYRSASSGPPLWCRNADLACNVGTSSAIGDMFVSATTGGDEFEVEFGASMTAPFKNASDNVLGVPITASVVPEPSTLSLLGASLAIGLLAGRRPRRQ